MSSLLEQAIIDAAALKEAALKNAEASIIEKYSVEVKEALKNLLEADEDPMAAPAPDMGMPPAPTEEPIKDVPMAATEGEKLCPCKEEEDKVEIDLDAIAAKLQDMGPTSTDSFGATGASAMGVPLNPQQQSGLGEGIYRIDKSILKESSDVVLEFSKKDLLSMLEEETQVSIGGLSTEDIPNTLTNDLRFKGQSFNLGGDSNHTQDAIKLSKAQLAAAEEEKEAAKKELEKMKKERDKTNKSLETLSESNAQLTSKIEQYESVVSVLKEKLDSFALSNAKLLYANRVLSNVSLNERQKNNIVEKLSNAKTPDEAKTVFETLQSSVQSASASTAPKSLNEAVTRNVISSLSGRREQEVTQPPMVERMQILAGIKK